MFHYKTNFKDLTAKKQNVLVREEPGLMSMDVRMQKGVVSFEFENKQEELSGATAVMC